MITIEQVLEVLKKDRNFRDIIDQDHYYYSWTGVTFEHLSYDSRDVTPSSLFFAKGAAFKREFLENAVKTGLSFYVTEKITKWESLPLLFQISSKL
ncbi:UDP-N-acetylmuramoylalanyl-D-glutamate-L-lysine ligase [Streptococcus sp. HSISS2]|nr:UDP-N-acetylmuramoylalanyl-D-glutamate-L-lysine ligase [Streptococcus sp. HSISS2]